jgi:hypothetical protein
MTRTLIYVVALLGSVALGGAPALTYMMSDQAEAAQTVKKTKKTVVVKKKYVRKRGPYCGYPQPPNQAGMTDYCSFEYNVNCRRGIGCDKFGRDFRNFDD